MVCDFFKMFITDFYMKTGVNRGLYSLNKVKKEKPPAWGRWFQLTKLGKQSLGSFLTSGD